MGNKSHFFRQSNGLSLVADYQFNNNLIDSVGGNNGTGTNISYNVGAYGNEAVFNGSTSEVRTPNSTVWDISDGTNDIPIKIEILVRLYDFNGLRYLVAKTPSGGSASGWEVVFGNNKIYIQVFDKLTSSVSYVACDMQYDQYGYSKIIIEYDGGYIFEGWSISVNNTTTGFEGDFTGYNGVAKSNTDATFGISGRRNDRRLDGVISQIKIYK